MHCITTFKNKISILHSRHAVLVFGHVCANITIRIGFAKVVLANDAEMFAEFVVLQCNST